MHELHNDLLFLPERMKIEKIEKLVANFHEKKNHVVLITNLEQVSNFEKDFQANEQLWKMQENLDISSL